MCPFRYIYHVLLFLASQTLLTSCNEWKAMFDPQSVRVKTASHQRVRVILSGLTSDIIDPANINDRNYVQLRSSDDGLAAVRHQENIRFFELERANNSFDANFDVSGVFLGKFIFAILITHHN